ncbi:MAG: hypothetical protein DMF53_24945 [Acidobacteria bacterium]|nr:MAG: hypothetical protein DMF53_24945 [Acidobacteriota bacterium]
MAEDRNATAAFVLAGISLLALLGWRSWRLRTVLALAALAALPGAVRADSGLLYTRPVEVPAQGLVRVPLDLATLRHLGASGEGLRVFGPAGEKIPAWIETAGAQDPETLWSPVGAPGGASFVISREQNLLGLVLSLGGSGSITHLRAHLEGSEDQKAWRPLGDEDLFEIPPGRNGSFLYVLPYPTVQDRFVRITIPDFNANVQNVSPAVSPVLSVPVDRLEPEDANGVTSYQLTFPARGQSPVWLHLDLAGPREAAVRVYAAEKGSWRLLVQGIRRASQPGSRFSIPILTKPLNGRELRIEIAGPGGGPRITGASLDLAQPIVTFRAGSPGRYELRYGDGCSYEGGRNDSPPSRYDDSARIAPGPESARELPPFPRDNASPVTPLDGRFAAAWPVQAAGARPGARWETGRFPTSARLPTTRPWRSPAGDCSRSVPSLAK